MIKVISGKKGTGKTKAIIDLANKTAEESAGHIVVIEKGEKLRFDITHKARLINIEEYEVENFDNFIGFLNGLTAANYDITDIFMDSTYKLLNVSRTEKLDELINALKKIEESEKINFILTISDDPSNLSDYVNSFS